MSLELFIDNILLSFVPLFVRALGVFVLIPFGSGTQTLLLRVGLGAGLAAISVPNLSQPIVGNLLTLPMEFIIGIVISIPAALFIGLSEMWGELFDAGRGQSIASMYDPISATTHSQMSILARYLVWSYLLNFGLLDQIVAGYFLSLESVPPLTIAIPTLGKLGMVILLLTQAGLTSVITTFLPFIGIFLILDFILGVMGKVCPNIVSNGEAFQLKSAASLTMVYFLLRFRCGEGIWAALISASSAIFGALNG